MPSGDEPQLSDAAGHDYAPGIGGAQGKSHTRAHLTSPDPDARRRALIALGSDPDAVLTLYRGLWDTNEAVRQEAARLLAHHATGTAAHLLSHAAQGDDHPGRLAAIATLGLLPAPGNLDLLINLVFQANNQLREAAREGLVLAGKAALDPLESHIILPPSNHVHQAMQAFARVASQVDNNAVKEHCQQILIDRLYGSRAYNEAADVLVYFPNLKVVTALFDAMRYGPDWVRGACGDALSRMGSLAIEPLLAYVQEVGLDAEGDRALRSLARMDFDLLPGILERLGRKAVIDRFALLIANYRVEHLRVMFNHNARRIRLAAIAALDERKPNNIQPLVEMSAHPDPHIRRRAVMALGNTPYETAQVITVLRQALVDEVWQIRAAACTGLGKLYERVANTAYSSESWQRRTFSQVLNHPGIVIPPLLITGIEDERIDVRVNAIRGLGRCADSTIAVDALVNVVRGKEQALHSEVIDALVTIGGEHESVHQALLYALSPTFSTAARYRAINALAHHGQVADLPQLMPLLADDSHLIRQKTAKIIRRIVWRSTGIEASTLQAMCPYLADGIETQRVFAAYVLAFFGHEDGIQALLLDLLKYNELPLMNASHLSRLFDTHPDTVKALAARLETDFGL